MNVSGERIPDHERERRYEIRGNRLSYLSSRIFGAIAGIEPQADLRALLARPHARYSLRTLVKRGLLDERHELTEEGELFAGRAYIQIDFPDQRQLSIAQFLDGRLPRRFWSKATPEPMGGCWLWLATTTERGYGAFGVNGKLMRAHRVSYLMLIGPIQNELELDHTCRNTSCVNPYHVEPVTHDINVKRGWDAMSSSRRAERIVQATATLAIINQKRRS